MERGVWKQAPLFYFTIYMQYPAAYIFLLTISVAITLGQYFVQCVFEIAEYNPIPKGIRVGAGIITFIGCIGHILMVLDQEREASNKPMHYELIQEPMYRKVK